MPQRFTSRYRRERDTALAIRRARTWKIKAGNLEDSAAGKRLAYS